MELILSKVKTNSMRILDSKNIGYDTLSYSVKGEHVDGVEVAKEIGRDVNQVYKTLVAQGTTKDIYIFVIPVHESLDLKKGAKIVKEKNIEMINIKDINKYTGYIRGGCSPIGMKKPYGTFVQESALNLDTMIVSAGKVGYQIEISPLDLQEVTDCKFVDLIK